MEKPQRLGTDERAQGLLERKLRQRMGRRQFIRQAGGSLLGAGVGGGLLAACGGGQKAAPSAAASSGKFAGQELRVAAWSGPYARSMREVFVPPFQEATGATVTIMDEWAEIVTKILAAPPTDPPFDLTIGEGYTQIYGIQKHLWLPVNYDNVPRIKDVYPWYLSDPAHDAESTSWGVPFGYAYEVIGYNKERVPFTPTSWADLWRPEVQGRLGMDGGFFNYALAPAAFLLGYDPATLQANTPQLDQVMAKTAELNVAVWYSSGAESVAALQNGDADILEMYIEDIGQLAVADPRYSWAFPKEGAMGWIDYYMPVRGTKVKDLAEAWCDHLLDPELQTQFAARHYYWMANEHYQIPGTKAQYFPKSNADMQQMGHEFDYDYWLPSFFDTNGVYTQFSKEVLKQ